MIILTVIIVSFICGKIIYPIFFKSAAQGNAKQPEAPNTPETQENTTQATQTTKTQPLTTEQKIIKTLKDSGAINSTVLPFVVAQVIFESGNFESYLSRTHNNFSGITYAGQKGATQGEPMPENPAGHYARFNTPEDWAKDYIRILNFGKAKPIEATTPEEFTSRLKANGYFTADETQYLNGLKYILQNNNVGKIISSVTSSAVITALCLFVFFSCLTLLIF